MYRERKLIVPLPPRAMSSLSSSRMLHVDVGCRKASKSFARSKALTRSLISATLCMGRRMLVVLARHASASWPQYSTR